jgi:hypothetical protein
MTITGDPLIEASTDASEPTGPREDRLAAAASKLRFRPGIPVDKWLQIAGTALPFLGLLAIVAAWYGVSHTAREWRQTPYVVSGGLLGLGLIFLGGFTYFAYWLTKLVEQSHRQTVALERIEAALTGRSPERGVGSDGLVVSGGVAHRPDCALLAGRDDVQPLHADVDVRGCAVCEPDLPPPPKPPARSRSSRRRTTK